MTTLPWDSPFVVPPKTPPGIIAELRTSFEHLSKDPDFRSEYLKVVGAEVDFTGLSERDVVAIRQSPPSVAEALKGLFANN